MFYPVQYVSIIRFIHLFLVTSKFQHFILFGSSLSWLFRRLNLGYGAEVSSQTSELCFNSFNVKTTRISCESHADECKKEVCNFFIISLKLKFWKVSTAKWELWLLLGSSDWYLIMFFFLIEYRSFFHELVSLNEKLKCFKNES